MDKENVAHIDTHTHTHTYTHGIYTYKAYIHIYTHSVTIKNEIMPFAAT